MYALLALVSLLVSAGSFYQYTQSGGQTMWLILLIVGVLGTVGFGALFLSGRVNKGEDIHITD
jgi:hypothetical protein